MFDESDFEKVLELVKAKKAKGMQSKGKLALTSDGELHAYLGFNYPDKMMRPFEDIMDETNIFVECMAEASGYEIVKSARF